MLLPRISMISIRNPLVVRQKKLWPPERKSLMKAFPALTFLHAAPAMGQTAKGNGAIPRLAGQLYPYVVTQLTSWAKERTEENSNIMAPIAHGLTESQINAVAAYVSSLE